MSNSFDTTMIGIVTGFALCLFVTVVLLPDFRVTSAMVQEAVTRCSAYGGLEYILGVRADYGEVEYMCSDGSKGKAYTE